MAKKSKKKAKKTAKKKDMIELTQDQFDAAVADAVAKAVAVKHPKPIPVDISGNTPFKIKLAAMDKDQLIQFGSDEFNLKIDSKLSEKVIIEQFIKLDNERKGNAMEVNKESLNKTASADDPPIRVKFLNLQSPTETINFSFAGPRGMYGPVNKTGHKKCPTYTLIPGEEYTLALSVKTHLESLTFTHYKTLIDQMTGQVRGNVPELKSKYALYPVFTKEQLISLQKPI